MPRIAVGADLCSGKWAVIRLIDGRFDAGAVLPNLRDVASTFARESTAIAVDIPMSYPPDGTKGRLCEREGRARLGPRRSSMFDTYPQAIMEAADYGTASTLAQSSLGMGIPRQSWALGPAIRDAIRTASSDNRFFETHPELVFARLAGVLAPKKSWTGFRQRLNALGRVGIDLPTELPSMDAAAMDDVIDAAAAAYVADQITLRIARRVPIDLVEPGIWY